MTAPRWPFFFRTQTITVITMPKNTREPTTAPAITPELKHKYKYHLSRSIWSFSRNLIKGGSRKLLKEGFKEGGFHAIIILFYLFLAQWTKSFSKKGIAPSRIRHCFQQHKISRSTVKNMIWLTKGQTSIRIPIYPDIVFEEMNKMLEHSFSAASLFLYYFECVLFLSFYSCLCPYHRNNSIGLKTWSYKFFNLSSTK